jgi:hypothetical protein
MAQLTDQLLSHFSEKFGIVTVVNATFYEVDGIVPKISFDTLKMSNITSEGQQKEIRGGQGAELLLQYDFGRTANVEITDALVSVGSLEYLFGGQQTIGTVSFPRRIEYTLDADLANAALFASPLDLDTADRRSTVLFVKADGTKGKLTSTLIGTFVSNTTGAALKAGTKIVLFYNATRYVGANKVYQTTNVTAWPTTVQITDYAAGTDTFTVVTQSDGDVFTFALNGALPTTLLTDYTPVSTDVIKVYYTSNANNGGVLGFREMVLKASDFPPIVRMVGETVVLDADTGKKVALQIEIPKFKLNANFTLSFDAEGDPSVFDFSGVALSHKGELIKVRTLGDITEMN